MFAKTQKERPMGIAAVGLLLHGTIGCATQFHANEWPNSQEAIYSSKAIVLQHHEGPQWLDQDCVKNWPNGREWETHI